MKIILVMADDDGGIYDNYAGNTVDDNDGNDDEEGPLDKDDAE